MDRNEVLNGEELERKYRRSREKFAAFMARMIEKYGEEVMAEIEAEEAQKGTQKTAWESGVCRAYGSECGSRAKPVSK